MIVRLKTGFLIDLDPLEFMLTLVTSFVRIWKWIVTSYTKYKSKAYFTQKYQLLQYIVNIIKIIILAIA